MDFFAQQQRARRNTTLMVVLFVFAVLAIVFAVNLVTAATWLALAYDTMLDKRAGLLGQVPAPVYWAGTLAALGTIAGGSLYRVMALSKGGVAVASMVGARWVKRNSQEPLERRLLNIVEEMAIASGIAMPAVFVMDEEKGINAFASGYSPNEAAVTVTRGALERLDRDELQGVIGHEFSHILNGDMRLNVRLLGVIAGIVLIGSVGRFLLTTGRLGGGNSQRRGDIRFFFLGLALWLIGWIGVFFARVIKAAVSREREYLADAASVQFTRNPQGIGGALYKIGQSSGAISNRYAEELSHMYFTASVGRAFLSLLDTHPPIEDRIKRVLGDRGLLFIRSQAKKTDADIESVPASAVPAADDGALAATSALAGLEWGRRAGDSGIRTSSDAVMDSVGRPSTLHIDYARRMLDELPDSVRQAIESADGPQAVLFALLVAPGGDIRDRQAAMIAGSAGDAIAAQTLALAQALKPLGERARLPVLDLVMPELKDRPQAERDRLMVLVQELIEADRRVSVFEFVLITICRRQFAGEPRGGATVKYRTAQSVSSQIAVVVSLLIHAGRGRPDMFEGTMHRLGFTGQRLRAPTEVGYREVEAALRELALLAPLAKPAVIKACLAVVMPEGEISIVQAELMRAICAALDTPLPPILDA